MPFESTPAGEHEADKIIVVQTERLLTGKDIAYQLEAGPLGLVSITTLPQYSEGHVRG